VRIDVAFMPALAAAFLLVFARIGTMLMLLPDWASRTSPRGCGSRPRSYSPPCAAAPSQRLSCRYQRAGPVIVLLVEEILIGAMLGLTARLTISALEWRAR